MSKQTILYAILALAMTVLPKMAWGITKYELSAIAESLESSIYDIQVEYEWIVDPPVPQEQATPELLVHKDGKMSFSWATKRPFQEKSMYSEDKTVYDGINSWNSSTKQTYNGKVGKYLKSNDKGGSRHNSGTLTKSKRFIQPPQLSPFAFTLERYNDKDNPISALLKSTSVKLSESKQKVGDFDTVEADFFFSEKDEVPYLKIFFSEKHNYTPVKFVHINEGKPTLVIEVNSLREVSPGLWFPDTGIIYDTRRENWSNIYKASDIKINQNIPDEFFDLEFPPGTKIADEILNSEYYYKPTEAQFDQWLADEEVISNNS